jgi:Tfp pilus assembly protein PilN
MSGGKDLKLVVGASPRVDLLPPEIKVSQRGAAIRRLLGFGAIVTVVVCGAGYGVATVHASNSQQALTDAQAKTQFLVEQQSQYLEVREVAARVDTIKQAQIVGAATEIDWSEYFTKVQATLPGDVIVDSFTVDAGTPIEAHPQATAPLQGQRVATISFSVLSPNLPTVQNWLEALKSLPGFADATPGTATLRDDTQIYTVDIVMHINSEAYSGRFAAATDDAAATGEEG